MFSRWRVSPLAGAALLALAALEWLYGENPSVTGPQVVRADFGATAIIGAIVSGIGWLLGSQGGRVDSFVARSLEGIKNGVSDLADKLIETGVLIAWQFARLWDWLKKHIGRIARGIYDVIHKFVQRVSRILDRILGPIIDFLDKVKDRVWEIYNDIVKPILDIIEFVRIPLRILSRFNVEWARKLDATLAEIQDEIVERFTFVMGRLNYTIDFLNDLVDVERLLKRFTFVRTLMRDLHILDSLLVNRWHRPLGGDKLQQYYQPFERQSIDQVNADLVAYVVHGAGPDRARIDEHAADLRLRLQRV